jgi:hypothetical protein
MRYQFPLTRVREFNLAASGGCEAEDSQDPNVADVVGLWMISAKTCQQSVKVNGNWETWLDSTGY